MNKSTKQLRKEESRLKNSLSRVQSKIEQQELFERKIDEAISEVGDPKSGPIFLLKYLLEKVGKSRSSKVFNEVFGGSVSGSKKSKSSGFVDHSDKVIAFLKKKKKPVSKADIEKGISEKMDAPSWQKIKKIIGEKGGKISSSGKGPGTVFSIQVPAKKK